jgi:outer membrane protein assembly factor BamB
LPLKGRRIAGPFAIAQGCLLQTDSELLAISHTGKQLWAIDFKDSEVVSRPSMAADAMIVVTRGGGVWSIDPSAGKVMGKLDAGQPLSSAALVVPAGLLVGSSEGAVLALPMPPAQTPKSLSPTGAISEVP